MASQNPLTIEQVQGVTVISFGGQPYSIHEEIIPDVSESLLGTEVNHADNVLMDLTGVDFFGSSFIEVIFRLWNRTRSKQNGQFALCGLHPYCKQVLDITNLSSVWKIFEDRSQAISTMQTESLS